MPSTDTLFVPCSRTTALYLTKMSFQNIKSYHNYKFKKPQNCRIFREVYHENHLFDLE